MNRIVRRAAAIGVATAVAVTVMLGFSPSAYAAAPESHTRTAASAQQQAAASVVYTRIVSGTTLWGTAARFCGNGALWYQITYVNGVHPSPTNLVIGWTLRVPCSLTANAPASTAPSTATVHPVPWARGSWPGGCFGSPRGDHRHAGVDLIKPYGTPIRAVRGGKVDRAGWVWGGYGISVVLNHSGWLTHYAHLSREVVYVGQWVRTGQTIGYVGSTGDSSGPHLHFEVASRTWVLGSQVDPAPFMRARGVNIGCA